MNTSIGNTYPREFIHNGYRLIIKSKDFIEYDDFKNLAFALEDDTILRNFFCKEALTDIFENYSTKNNKNNKRSNENFRYHQLFNFILDSRLVPRVITENPSSIYCSHISTLANTADQFFNSTIKKSLTQVCEKASRIGVISCDTLIDLPKHDVEGVISGKLCFYKISQSLYETWVKPEKKGFFLETWIYYILKEHFKSYDNIDVMRHVLVMNIEENEPDSVGDLVKLPKSECKISDISEIDVLIRKNNKPICLIECKNHEAQMPDVLKLYGLKILLNIQSGIVVTHSFRKCKEITDFEGIHIVPNILNNVNFPKNLFNLVEEIIKNSTD